MTQKLTTAAAKGTNENQQPKPVEPVQAFEFDGQLFKTELDVAKYKFRKEWYNRVYEWEGQAGVYSQMPGLNRLIEQPDRLKALVDLLIKHGLLVVDPSAIKFHNL
jgi:hypothetical protein